MRVGTPLTTTPSRVARTRHSSLRAPRLSAARRAFGPQHQQRRIADGGDHAGVGHRHHGRRVDDDLVVAALELLEQLGEEAVVEQLDRVGRQRAARQEVERLDARGDDGFVDGPAVGQHRGEALVRRSTSKIWCCVGLRMSASMSSTF